MIFDHYDIIGNILIYSDIDTIDSFSQINKNSLRLRDDKNFWLNKFNYDNFHIMTDNLNIKEYYKIYKTIKLTKNLIALVIFENNKSKTLISGSFEANSYNNHLKRLFLFDEVQISDFTEVEFYIILFDDKYNHKISYSIRNWVKKDDVDTLKCSTITKIVNLNDIEKFLFQLFYYHPEFNIVDKNGYPYSECFCKKMRDYADTERIKYGSTISFRSNFWDFVQNN